MKNQKSAKNATQETENGKPDRGGGRNPLITAAAVIAAVAGAGFLAYHLLTAGRFHPLALLALAAAFAIAIPMLRAAWFPSAQDCIAEYDFHEKRLEHRGQQTIEAACGTEAIRALYAGTDRFQPSADRTCRRLLDEQAPEADPELRFSLLVTLARICEKTGTPREGIEHLAAARRIKPDHFVVNYRLAMIREWAGDAEGALRDYERALRSPEDVSRGMKKLAAAQLARLTARSESDSPPR